MDRLRIAPFLMTLAALAGATPALPQGLPETAAALVAVSVELDGRAAALYPAPDGSGRYYVEARKGCRYSIALANRTGERVGVVLTVDGLNAISGERETGRGRMYVLDPWQRTRSRVGARRSRRCGSSPSWTSGPPTPRAPPRPTRRWAGSRSRPTASAARSCARPRGASCRHAPRPSSRKATGRPERGTRERGGPRLGRGGGSEAARRRAGPGLPGHRLGRPRARPRRAGELRPRERAERARDAALRVPAGPRRPRRPAPPRAAPRPPVGARPRRAGLLPAAAVVSVRACYPARRAGLDTEVTHVPAGGGFPEGVGAGEGLDPEGPRGARRTPRSARRSRRTTARSGAWPGTSRRRPAR